MSASIQIVGGKHPKVTDVQGNGLENVGLEMTTAPEGTNGVDVTDVAFSSGHNMGSGNANDKAERAARYPPGASTSVGAVANFVNTIVGAGIVGLPFALAESGLLAGLVMMFLAAFLTNRSTTMLISTGEKTGRLNYEELMADMFGTWGLHFFSLFAGVLAFGAMSAYLIIIGDTVPSMLVASGVTTGVLSDRASVIAIFGFAIILPVSLLKEMSKLSYTSFVSVMADVLLTIIVLFAAPGEASKNDVDQSNMFTFIRPTIFAGFGAMSFAFVCQSSSFLVYRSMSKGGVDRWSWVTQWSVGIALAMGLTLGLGGYLNFAEDTEGNILNSFSVDHKFASVARGFLAVTMIFTYPMEMYVARHVLDVSVFQTMLGMGPITTARHCGITLFLWVLTILLAVSTDDLGPILEFFGAFGASAVGYIMPALLYIQANRVELRAATAVWRKGTSEYDPSFGGKLWALKDFYVPTFMAVFGLVAMVAGVSTAVLAEMN